MATLKFAKQEERINAERERLEEVFADIPDKAMRAVTSLIKNAAFMTITLEDLQKKINSKGPITKYKNGENQYGTKKSPEVEIYNTMVKNHASIIKQLTDLIVVDDQDGKEEDEFIKIMRRDRSG